MSETPITVNYSLEEVLARIEGKVDELKIDLHREVSALHREVNDLRREIAGEIAGVKIELAEVKTEVKGIKEDVIELKGSSKAQIWTLIGILLTAVGGFLVAILKIPLGSPL